MLIPFPIAFLSGVVVTDLVYRQTLDGFWARASFWLLVAGLATGALASLFGFIDFLTIRRAHSVAAGWVHFLGNAVVLALAAGNLYLRWEDMEGAVLSWGLALSSAIAALLVLTGWLGGELSSRHKIGVMGYAGSAPRAAAIEQRRTV